MPKLTPEEKAENARQRMIETAKKYQLGTYMNRFVAKVFQKMVRAEAASEPARYTAAVVNGQIDVIWRRKGECVCVTCGFVGPWASSTHGASTTIQTGHYLAGRRASIVLEPTNAHPQCSHCNDHKSGNQALYEIWMRHVYGQEEIDRLRRLKTESVSFSREELVDMRIEFQKRLRAAEERMKG